jgi:hypothetical protein
MIHRAIIGYIIIFSCCICLSCSKNDSVRPPVITPPAPLAGKTYSASEITAFKQMTLYATGEIIQWPKKVSFYIVDTGYTYMTKAVDSILQEMNLLLDTNLVLTRTNNRTEADMEIYLTDHNTYLAAEPAATVQKADYIGLTFLQWDVQGIIDHGSVFVDMPGTVGDTTAQYFIMHHEMMHALGFYAHVSLQNIYSVLYDEPQLPLAGYTPFDKRMMLLLYNPSIRAGMSEVEFNEVIKNL